MSERGDVADWLGTGLQSPLIGFDSRRRLKNLMSTPAPSAKPSATRAGQCLSSRQFRRRSIALRQQRIPR